jgi:hypothetical protein
VELKVRKRNIYNFDEVGFRVGCAKGQWLLVPKDILEVYILNSILNALLTYLVLCS